MFKLKRIFEYQTTLFDVPNTSKDVVNSFIKKYADFIETKINSKYNTKKEVLALLTGDEKYADDYLECLKQAYEFNTDSKSNRNSIESFLNSLDDDKLSTLLKVSFDELEEQQFDTLEDLFNLDLISDDFVDEYNSFLKSSADNLIEIFNQEYLDQIIDVVEYSNGYIDIYRKMVISEKLLKQQIKGVGIYWSYEKNSTDIYNSIKIDSDEDIDDIEIILEGYTDYSNINWKNTLTKSLYDLNEEKEIELDDNGFMYLTKIHIIHAMDIDIEMTKIENYFKHLIKNKDLLDNIIEDKKNKIATITLDKPLKVKV